jgi:hypothetical protein
MKNAGLEETTMRNATPLIVVGFSAINPAFAQAGPETLIPYPDWIVFALSLVFTVWWSLKAFDRSFKLVGVPTFPRYMTRSGQYRLGQILFSAGCTVLYALMVRYHRDIPAIIAMAEPELAEKLKILIEENNPSYLIIVIIVSIFYVSLLGVEARLIPLSQALLYVVDALV